MPSHNHRPRACRFGLSDEVPRECRAALQRRTAMQRWLFLAEDASGVCRVEITRYTDGSWSWMNDRGFADEGQPLFRHAELLEELHLTATHPLDAIFDVVGSIDDYEPITNPDGAWIRCC